MPRTGRGREPRSRNRDDEELVVKDARQDKYKSSRGASNRDRYVVDHADTATSASSEEEDNETFLSESTSGSEDDSDASRSSSESSSSSYSEASDSGTEITDGIVDEDDRDDADTVDQHLDDVEEVQAEPTIPFLDRLFDTTCGWLDRQTTCVNLVVGSKHVSLLRESRLNGNNFHVKRIEGIPRTSTVVTAEDKRTRHLHHKGVMGSTTFENGETVVTAKAIPKSKSYEKKVVKKNFTPSYKNRIRNMKSEETATSASSVSSLHRKPPLPANLKTSNGKTSAEVFSGAIDVTDSAADSDQDSRGAQTAPELGYNIREVFAEAKTGETEGAQTSQFEVISTGRNQEKGDQDLDRSLDELLSDEDLGRDGMDPPAPTAKGSENKGNPYSHVASDANGETIDTRKNEEHNVSNRSGRSGSVSITDLTHMDDNEVPQFTSTDNPTKETSSEDQDQESWHSAKSSNKDPPEELALEETEKAATSDVAAKVSGQGEEEEKLKLASDSRGAKGASTTKTDVQETVKKGLDATKEFLESGADLGQDYLATSASRLWEEEEQKVTNSLKEKKDLDTATGFIASTKLSSDYVQVEKKKPKDSEEELKLNRSSAASKTPSTSRSMSDQRHRSDDTNFESDRTNRTTRSRYKNQPYPETMDSKSRDGKSSRDASKHKRQSVDKNRRRAHSPDQKSESGASQPFLDHRQRALGAMAQDLEDWASNDKNNATEEVEKAHRTKHKASRSPDLVEQKRNESRADDFFSRMESSSRQARKSKNRDLRESYPEVDEQGFLVVKESHYVPSHAVERDLTGAIIDVKDNDVKRSTGEEQSALGVVEDNIEIRRKSREMQDLRALWNDGQDFDAETRNSQWETKYDISEVVRERKPRGSSNMVSEPKYEIPELVVRSSRSRETRGSRPSRSQELREQVMDGKGVRSIKNRDFREHPARDHQELHQTRSRGESTYGEASQQYGVRQTRSRDLREARSRDQEYGMRSSKSQAEDYGMSSTRRRQSSDRDFRRDRDVPIDMATVRTEGYSMRSPRSLGVRQTYDDREHRSYREIGSDVKELGIRSTRSRDLRRQTEHIGEWTNPSRVHESHEYRGYGEDDFSMSKPETNYDSPIVIDSGIRKSRSRDTRGEPIDAEDYHSRSSKIRESRRHQSNSEAYQFRDERDARSKSSRKSKKSTTSNPAEYDEHLTSAKELRKLEKKLEKQLKQLKKDKEKSERDDRSRTSLRSIEKQLVRKLRRGDEKRASRLERLKKRSGSSQKPRSPEPTYEGQSISEIVRADHELETITQKAEELRLQAKEAQDRTMRSSKPPSPFSSKPHRTRREQLDELRNGLRGKDY